MGKSFKILIIAVVGLLIIGGITRFHHHTHDATPCFCIAAASSDNCHHADDCDNPLSQENHSEESCPLRIDFFKISEHQDPEHHIACCDIHCDICSPLVFNPDDYNQAKLTFIYRIFINCPYHNCEVDRRGPPSFV